MYAIAVSSRPVHRLTGMAGERLRAIAFDGVMAIVGDVRHRPAASTRNLRQYAAVVESIAARMPAVLPARFGTTFDDVAELTLMLQSRGATMRRRLRAVRGRTQMTIRLLGSDPANGPLRGQTPVTSRTGVRPRNKSTQGTQYLRQRLAVLRTAREVPELAPIRPAIRRFVRDERVERRGDVATIHHLIPRAMVERYRAAVERTAAESDVRLAVSGPFAPYAFADNW
ncbi:MAG TPA: GvpL/GvpF family gas vesicle protein [Vicinamibacterales bacterium]|nr:GvpL/GvpF family gas vesicle protein [Vicinamibacterales bacterium]